MTQLNDAQFQSLRDQGFTGALNDMMLQWLQANGATSFDINTAWGEFLAGQGYTQMRNDGEFQLYRDLGYMGSLNDMALQFWADGGTLVGPSVRIDPVHDDVHEGALIGKEGDTSFNGTITVDYDPQDEGKAPAVASPLTINGTEIGLGAGNWDIPSPDGNSLSVEYVSGSGSGPFVYNYLYTLKGAVDSRAVPSEAFVVVATDNAGLGDDSQTARTLTAHIVDDRPVAPHADFGPVNTADTVTFNPFTNGGFVDSADVVPEQPLGAAGGVSIKVQPTLGEASVNLDGHIVYDPDDFEADDGELDTIIYTLTDGDGSESDGRMRVLIGSAFDAVVTINNIEYGDNPARHLLIEWVVTGDEADDIDQWQIAWATQPEGGEWNVLATALPGPTRSYTDTGLDPEETRYYRVIGADLEPATRFTDPSNVGEGVTSPYEPPAEVSLAFNNVDTVAIAWDNVDDDKLSLNVYRSEEEGAPVLIDNVGPTIETYDDGTVSTDTNYSYVIESVHPGGFTAPSEVAEIFTKVVEGRAAALLANVANGVALDFLDRSYAVKQNNSFIAGAAWTQEFDTDPGNGILHPQQRLPNGQIGFAPMNRIRGSQQMNDSRWYRQLISTAPVPGLRGEEATEVTCDGTMGEHFFGTYRASRRTDVNVRAMYRVRKESGDANYIHMSCWNNHTSSSYPGPDVKGVFDLNTMQWIPGTMTEGILDYGSYPEEDGYFVMWHEFRMVGGDRNSSDLYRLSISNDQGNIESDCSGVIRLCMPQWSYAPNENFDVHLWTRMDTGSSSSGYARHLPAVNYDRAGNCEGRYMLGANNQKNRLCGNQRMEYWTDDYGNTGLKEGAVNMTLQADVAGRNAPDGFQRANLIQGDGSTGTPYMLRYDGELRNDDIPVAQPSISTPNDNAVSSIFVAPYAGHQWVRLYADENIYQDFDIINGVLGSAQGIDQARINQEVDGWYQIKVQAKGMAGVGYWRFELLSADGDNTWPGGNGSAGCYIWMPMRTPLDIDTDEFNTSELTTLRHSPNGPVFAKWGEMGLPGDFWPPGDTGGTGFVQVKGFELDLDALEDNHTLYLASPDELRGQSDIGIPPGMPEMIVAQMWAPPMLLFTNTYSFSPPKYHLGFSFEAPLGPGPTLPGAKGSYNGQNAIADDQGDTPRGFLDGDYTVMGTSGVNALQAFWWTPDITMNHAQMNAITADLSWPVSVGQITGLEAEPTGVHGEILLEWNRHMGTAETIEIERKKNSEPDSAFALVKELPAHRRRWRDRHVPTNEEYAYRLRLHDDDTDTDGPWTNPVTESPDW